MTMIEDLRIFISQPNAYRSVLILMGSILLAYWLSKIFSNIVIRIAQKVSSRGDSESDEAKHIRYRQIETYLSVAIAMIRATFVAVVAFIVWDYLSPISNSGVAAIGAGTVFIVVAGQTLGIILRDLTAGTAMIAEHWFNVGDFIKVEPFMDISGVVERMTLRSVRLRSLSGEVIYINNQYIQAVHVTPNAVRKMAVDVFTRNRELGEGSIKQIIDTIPAGPTMLAQPLKIKKIERWGEDLWRIVIVGQATPGRVWLIDNYFVNAVAELDEGKKREDRIFVHAPLARYADDEADKRFKRAIRVKRDSQ